MNRINNWKDLLKLANEDLKKYNMSLVLKEDDCAYSLIIVGPGKIDKYCFAENCYEDELGELINDAWAHARTKAEHARRPKAQNNIKDIRIFSRLIYDITTETNDILTKYIIEPKNRFETVWNWANECKGLNDPINMEFISENDKRRLLNEFINIKINELKRSGRQQVNITIDELFANMKIGTRTKRILESHGIERVGELFSFTRNELKKFKGFGTVCLREVDRLSQEYKIEYGSVPMSEKHKELYLDTD